MEGQIRHKFLYKLLRFLLRPYLIFRFGYTYDQTNTDDAPYIVLSNHNTDWDPLLVAMSFKEQMYFVASEHIFRWGMLSRLIIFLVAPIARVKATADALTVIDILKALRAGSNVCIFAEGNRSFNGETCTILPSTGKLVKHCGVALVTYRLDGGYFTSPRWSTTLRRGAMHGQSVNVYSPQQLSQMSVDEINLAINKDLYVNAYIEQAKDPIAYHGKNLAENLETILYLCPKCLRLSTLKGKGDELTCACGLRLCYTQFGLLTGTKGETPFSTILDWDKWQIAELKRRLPEFRALPHDVPIISDNEQLLYICKRETTGKLLGVGRLCLYNDRIALECSDKCIEFALDQIVNMATHGQMVLIFSLADNRFFEIKSPYPRSAVLYLMLYRLLKNEKPII